MDASTAGMGTQAAEATELDPFDLDIRVIESGDAAASLINITDDGCGSTCGGPCVTNVG
jgi:FxLD family lantipeptide